MRTSWTRFIVRDERYPQNPLYGEFCAKVVADLAQKFSRELNLDRIIRHIAQTLTDNMGATAAGDKEKFGYGVLRHDYQNNPPFDEFKGGTDIRAPYDTRFDEFLKFAEKLAASGNQQYSKDGRGIDRSRDDIIRFRFTTSEGKELDLSGIYTNSRGIWYPVNHRPEIFAEIERHANFALTSSSEEEKTIAIATSYYLLSHLCPLHRGSATMAMIFREFLAERGGIETFPMKPNVNLNLEALLTPPEDFVSAYVAGKYDDRGAALEEIRLWYQRAVAVRDGAANSPTAR